MAAKPWHWMGPTGLLTLVSCSGTVQKSKCTPQSPPPPGLNLHDPNCASAWLHLLRQPCWNTADAWPDVINIWRCVVAAVSTVLLTHAPPVCLSLLHPSVSHCLGSWALSCHRNTDCVSMLLRSNETFQFCSTSYVRRRLRRLCRRGGATAPSPPERRVVFPTSER